MIAVCRAVTSKKCGKTTWAGCGRHVDQVMVGVPQRDRGTCGTDGPGGGEAASGWTGRAPRFLSRLLGRR